LFIATLIAAGRLDDRLLHQALERVPGASFLAWVDQGDAADLGVPGLGARHALEGWQGCDVVVQPAADREKRLLVADMDSTIIGQECIDELAAFAGVKPQVAAITERAMRGELDFEAALRERVALLRDLPVSMIRRCLDERIRLNPGAANLVRTMRARGAATMLISGGFIDFVAPIAAAAGFEAFEANILARDDDRLVGEVDGPIVDRAAKRAALVRLRAAEGLSPAQTMAIGDGANDLLMIEEAGLGVAFRAKPVLAEQANARLDHHDLDALLWAQGIPRREWVED
jgi:phosphoserine phosphatase